MCFTMVCKLSRNLCLVIIVLILTVNNSNRLTIIGINNVIELEQGQTSANFKPLNKSEITRTPILTNESVINANSNNSNGENTKIIKK